jgi:HTH-type transcriptional regulator / antitoxin HigA
MIQNEKQYKAILERIDELLLLEDSIENEDSKNYIELNMLSDLVADYEEQKHPIDKPSLAEIIKFKMKEMDLNQIKVAEILEVSTSRVSEYMTGKSEPTLKVARRLSQKLNIEPSLILGV